MQEYSEVGHHLFGIINDHLMFNYELVRERIFVFIYKNISSNTHAPKDTHHRRQARRARLSKRAD